MNGWRQARVNGLLAWVGPAGQVVRRRRTTYWASAEWIAYRSDGTPVRVDVNADGTPYTPRPWHTGAELPHVRRFPTAGLGRQVLERLAADDDGKA